jgi:tRNA threonylcarbamoyl adenosine modification protein YeaZ
MNKHKLSFEELDFIACTVGPGSFGGLRVGVAAVNALKILVPKVQVLGFNTLEVVANAALPIDAKSLVAVSHGNKCYIARSDTQGRLLEEISAVHKDELAALVGKNAKLITVESGNSFIPGSKVVNLNAAAVMRFAQKVIQEERINLYNQVSPIYISEPSITVAK